MRLPIAILLIITGIGTDTDIDTGIGPSLIPSNRSLEPEGSNVVGQSDIWLTEYNFDEDMFVGKKNRKEKKSRSEKRDPEDHYKHARQKIMVGDMTFDISRQQLRKFQEEDHRI